MAVADSGPDIGGVSPTEEPSPGPPTEGFIDTGKATEVVRKLGESVVALDGPVRSFNATSLPAGAFGELPESDELGRKLADYFAGAGEAIQAAVDNLDSFVGVMPSIIKSYEDGDEEIALGLTEIVQDGEAGTPGLSRDAGA